MDEIIKLVNEERETWKKSDDERDAGLPTNIPEVERHDDLSYGKFGKENLLDLYLPKSRKGKMPVIVNVHGGGWCYGTKETYQFYCLYLAKNGFATINFNYRLAPETTFPGALEDVNQVFHWLAQNADNYGLDLNNIFVVGDSAGGQLAEQYATLLTNSEYRKEFDFKMPDLKIKALGLNCGAYFLDEPGTLFGATLAYFGENPVERLGDKIKTEKFITKDFPQTYLVTSNLDPLHDKAIRLDQFLKDHGLKSQVHIYGDESHPRQHDFQINQKDDIAKKCNDEELAYFKSLVK